MTRAFLKLSTLAIAFALQLSMVHLIHGQISRIDSMKQVLDTVKVPRIHVNTLHDLSTQYTFINADSAEFYVDKGLVLAKKFNLEKGLALSYRQKGVIQFVRGNLTDALTWMDSSMTFRKKIGDIAGQVLVLNNKALIYQNLNQYEKSKDMLFEALSVARQNNVKNREAEILNNVALYFSRFNQFDSAIFYHKASLVINKEINNLSEMALVESNMGVIHFKQSHFREALSRFQRAYELALASGNKRTEVDASQNMAVIYNQIGLHKRAIAWYLKLQETLKQSDNELSKLSLQSNLAAAYLENGQYQNAYEEALVAIEMKESSETQYQIARSYYIAGLAILRLGDRQEAIRLFQTGLKYLQDGELQTESVLNNSMASVYIERREYGKAKVLLLRNLQIQEISAFPDALTHTYEHLARLESERNNFEKAYEYQLVHDVFQDSLLNEEKTNALIRSAIAFDTERKDFELQLSNEREALSEAEITSLEAQRKTMRYTFGALAILLLVIILWRLQIARNRRLILIKETERLSLSRENERLKNQELKRELELKYKEVLGQALQLAQKNEAILDLKERLTKELKEQPNEALRRTIQSLDGKINVEKDWTAFRTSFEGVYKRFFDKIKADFDSLTARELQLCALLRLNLSIKEMSNVLGISQEGVKKARYRIRKKLGLTDVPDSLASFLMKY